MATVFHNVKIVPVVVDTKVSDGVSITLTETEAKVLRGILGDLVTNDVTSPLFNQLANIYPIKEYTITVTQKYGVCHKVEADLLVAPFPARKIV